jgi:hypothetical protein
MIRPWMGVLSVLLGVAALPCSAMAQDPDTTGPAITIATPANGATYEVGQPVSASYSCVDPSGVTDCMGNVPSGAAVDTSTAGPFTFTVTSHDAAGNASSATASYTVVVKDDGDLGGSAPATLSMVLGTPAPFAPFTPGVPRDYTTSFIATIISTAADATLTVADASATNTGQMVNGTYALAQPLKAAGASANQYGHAGAGGIVGGSANPTTLVTYDGPVTNDPATLTFTQSIGGTDALRTGAYSKTLTFTLSTTNP